MDLYLHRIGKLIDMIELQSHGIYYQSDMNDNVPESESHQSATSFSARLNQVSHINPTSNSTLVGIISLINISSLQQIAYHYISFKKYLLSIGEHDTKCKDTYINLLRETKNQT